MKKAISFNMQDISVDQFAILCNSIPSEGRYRTDMQIGVDKENKAVAIRMKVTYCDANEKELLLIQVTCMFSVKPEDWNKLLREDGKITFPHDFLAHLAVHTFGTMRGILYCKTVGSPIGAQILVPTNVDELVPQEFTI